SNRPPETACSVAAMLASTPGTRLATLRTSGPSATRLVTSASAVSTVHASGTPGPSRSSGSRRWSHVQRPSKPAASAASAAARMSAQRALIGINSRSVFMTSWRPRVSSDMSRRIFIGTAAGLWTLEGETSREVETFAGHAVTALAIDADAAWAIIEGSSLWELRERAWRRRAALEGPRAMCLAPARNGLLVGTEQAPLLRVTDAGVARIEAFEAVAG